MIRVNHSIQIINRRLQLSNCFIICIIIIAYKSLTGDYSVSALTKHLYRIIAYKSLTGDYSEGCKTLFNLNIIAYKSLTGDYSVSTSVLSNGSIIAYKSLTGDYSERYRHLRCGYHHSIQIINRRLQLPRCRQEF